MHGAPFFKRSVATHGVFIASYSSFCFSGAISRRKNGNIRTAGARLRASGDVFIAPYDSRRLNQFVCETIDKPSISCATRSMVVNGIGCVCTKCTMGSSNSTNSIIALAASCAGTQFTALRRRSERNQRSVIDLGSIPDVPWANNRFFDWT